MGGRLFPLDRLRSVFLTQEEIASPMPAGRRAKSTDIILFFKLWAAGRGEFISAGWRISS
jgi:hypothetical protein